MRDDTWIRDIVVRRILPNPDGWKEDVEAARSGTPRNNAVNIPPARQRIRVDQLDFRDQGEVRVYEKLKQLQDLAESRVREHVTEPVHPWAAWWAAPAYRLLIDPDGRPSRLRRARHF